MSDVSAAESGSSSDPVGPPAGKKRRRGRWLLTLVLLLLLLVGVVAAALPGILSGAWGRAVIVGNLNAALAGSVSIDDLALAWFDGQRITGVTLRDPEGETAATVPALTVEGTLWSLVTGGRDLGAVTLDQPELHVVAYADGSTNLMRAIGPLPAGDPDAPIQLPVRFKLAVADALVTATQPGIEPVRFEQLTLNVDATTPSESITYDLTGRTRQGELTGDIDLSGTLAGFNAEGVLHPEAMRLSASGRITDLPVQGIDALAGFQGRLGSLIGPRLNLTLNSEPARRGLGQQVRLRAEADNLRADLRAGLSPDGVAASGEATVTLTPAWTQSLLAGAIAKRDAPQRDTAPGDGASADALAGWNLTGPSDLTLTLDEFRAPLGAPEPAKTAIRATVTLSDAGIALTPTGDGNAAGGAGARAEAPAIHWRDLRATVSAPALDEPIRITADAKTEASGQAGTINVDATLRDLLNADGRPQLDQMTAEGNVNLTDFPTALTEALGGLPNGLAREAIGERIEDLTVTLEPTDGQTMRATVGLTAPGVTATLPLAMADGAITLTDTGKIDLRPTPALVMRYLPGDTLGIQPADSQAERLHARLDLETLRVPLPKADQRMPALEQAVVNGTLTVSPFRLADKADEPMVDMRMTALAITLTGDSLSDAKVTVEAKARHDSEETLAALASGQSIAATLTLTTGLRAKAASNPTDPASPLPWPIKPIAFDLTLVGPAVDGTHLAGTISDDLRTLTLDERGRLQYGIQPALLARLDRMFAAVNTESGTLAKPTKATITLRRLTAPLRSFEPAAINARLNLAMDRATLTGGTLDGVTFTALGGNLTLDGPANTLTANLTGALVPPETNRPTADAPRNIELTANLTDWHHDGQTRFPEASGKATVTMRDLPTAFLAALAGRGDDLPRLLGPNLKHITLTAERTDDAAEEPLKIDADFESDHTTFDGAFEVNMPESGNLAIRSTAPINATQRISDAMLQRWVRASNEQGATVQDFALVNPAAVSMRLNRVALTLPGALATAGGDAPAEAGDSAEDSNSTPPVDYRTVALDGRITAEPLALRHRATDETATLKNARLTVKTENLAEQLALTLKADLSRRTNDARAEAKPGAIDLTANLANLTDDAGLLDPLAGDATIDGGFEQLPVALVDAVGTLDGYALAALGDTADGTVEAKLTDGAGPINLTLNAPRAEMTLDGRLSDGVLKAGDPTEPVLTAKVEVSEALGDKVLRTASPFFKSVRGEQPVTLTVPGEGFAVPLRGFSPRQVTLRAARIEAGEMTVRTDRLWRRLMEVIGESAGPTMSLQTTPIVLSLERGTLNYQRRVDLLLDGSMHLVLWGNVELGAGDGPVRLNQTIAFTAQTLDKLLGLDNLRSDDLLRVPIRGSALNPDIDYRTAGAEYGKLKLVAEGGDTGRRIKEGLDLFGKVLEGGLGGNNPLQFLRGSNPPPMSVEQLPWKPVNQNRSSSDSANGAPAADRSEGGASRKQSPDGTDEKTEDDPSDRRSPEDRLKERLIEDIFGR